MHKPSHWSALPAALVWAAGLAGLVGHMPAFAAPSAVQTPASTTAPARRDTATALVAAARAQIGVTVLYDPAYTKIDYPLGDVPLSRGVCTDVVVRAYRKQGVDLQALVHRDMQAAWEQYPQFGASKRPTRTSTTAACPIWRCFFAATDTACPSPATQPHTAQAIS